MSNLSTEYIQISEHGKNPRATKVPRLGKVQGCFGIQLEFMCEIGIFQYYMSTNYHKNLQNVKMFSVGDKI